MPDLTIEKLLAAKAALEQQQRLDVDRAWQFLPFIAAPRLYQDLVDVARPSRRWARRFIPLSRREQLGMDRAQPYRAPALRFRKGRSAVMRRGIRRSVRPMPAPQIFT